MTREALIGAMDNLIEALNRASQPGFAAVNDHAHAGGLLLAQGCDVRLVTDAAVRRRISAARYRAERARPARRMSAGAGCAGVSTSPADNTRPDTARDREQQRDVVR